MWWSRCLSSFMVPPMTLPCQNRQVWLLPAVWGRILIQVPRIPTPRIPLTSPPFPRCPSTSHARSPRWLRAGAPPTRRRGAACPPALHLLQERRRCQLLPPLPHGECRRRPPLPPQAFHLQGPATKACLNNPQAEFLLQNLPADGHGVPVRPADHAAPAPAGHGVCCVGVQARGAAAAGAGSSIDTGQPPPAAGRR